MRGINSPSQVSHIQPNEPRMDKVYHEGKSTHSNESFPSQEIVDESYGEKCKSFRTFPLILTSMSSTASIHDPG